MRITTSASSESPAGWPAGDTAVTVPVLTVSAASEVVAVQIMLAPTARDVCGQLIEPSLSSARASEFSTVVPVFVTRYL